MLTRLGDQKLDPEITQHRPSATPDDRRESRNVMKDLDSETVSAGHSGGSTCGLHREQDLESRRVLVGELQCLVHRLTHPLSAGRFLQHERHARHLDAWPG
jgi:hypothetical protein